MGVYWMFYSGGDFTLVEQGTGGRKEKGLLMRPGLALSQDGCARGPTTRPCPRAAGRTASRTRLAISLA